MGSLSFGYRVVSIAGSEADINPIALSYFFCCLQMLPTTIPTPSLSLFSGRQLKAERRQKGSYLASRKFSEYKPVRSRKQVLSVVCAGAALRATCSASGQTSTITQKAPTITQFPVHVREKAPELDDGGTGFPPRDDDGGGGGGGGGGGNWSGGFFLFGFLAFLGFLKDKESEEDYRDSRRR